MPVEEIEVHFPDCQPGEEYIRDIELTDIGTILKIEREREINPCQLNFKVTYELHPKKMLHIIYRPDLPNTHNFDYFNITTETREIVQLKLSGMTLGPRVVCKTNKLVFNCTNPDPAQQSVNIENSGAMDTIFQFDIDNNNTDITISPRQGTIMKGETIVLLVTFHPKQPAIIFRQIICLILHQEPFLITIRANYKRTSVMQKFDDFIYLHEMLPTYPNNYEAYMQDIATKLFQESKPVVTLDRKYIDFGMINPIKGLRSNIESFSITNHSMVRVKIIWLIDGCNNFSVQPLFAEVSSGSGTVFQAKFEPCLPDQFYSATIIARIQWGSNYDFVVPFPLSIIFIGHTFTEMRTGWDPFYQVTKKIILPPTVPNTPCYGSYKLQNTGHFQLIFKFSPPVTSIVTLKPLHGIIEGGSFQIFTIRLFPGVKADSYYSEKWTLQINFLKKIDVEISTTTELPYLIFSNNESIKFTTTNIHTDNKISVPIKNESRLTLKFKLMINETDSPFFSENQTEIIRPNELTHIILHYCPHSYGKVTSHVYFEIKCVNPNIPQTYTSTITKIEGRCSKVSLKAVPDYLYLGNTLMRNWIFGTFIVINDSRCDAYVNIEVKPRFYVDLDVINKVEPKSFIIPAMTKFEISVGSCPQQVGFQKMYVTYNLCTDQTLQMHIEQCPTKLMTFDVNCSTPTFQVIDLRISRNNPNHSKYLMWKRLQINQLNRSLKNLKYRPEDSEIPVYMKLSVGGIGSDPDEVDLLIKNISTHKAKLDINFVKQCNCRSKVEDVSMTFRKLIKKCPHEEQISFAYQKQIFQPQEEGIVTLKWIYTNRGRKTFLFNLYVTAMEDTNIRGYTTLYLERVCCKPGLKHLDFNSLTSLTTTVMVNASPVFVGDPCKPYQVIWTFNNFKEEIEYEIKSNELDELEIFEFPHPKGLIHPDSVYPIVYRFNPYQYKTYTKIFNFITADVTFVLNMTGEGQIMPSYNTYSMLNKVPAMSLFSEKADIEVSLDNIVLKPMLLHSTMKQLIFLKNNTNATIEFCWTKKRFGAMFNVRAEPQRGIMKFNEVVPCQIVIESLSIPSKLTIYITCKFFNLDQIRLTQTKAAHFRKNIKLFDSTFDQTEQIDFHPMKINVKSVPKTVPTYFNVTISVYSLSEKNLDLVMPNINEQMKALTTNKLDTIKEPVSHLSREEAHVCIDSLSRVAWEILNRNIFLKGKIENTTYYGDMAECEILTAVSPSSHLIENIFSTAIYKGILNLFGISITDENELIKQKNYIDEKRRLLNPYMNNKYYADILEQGCYCIVSTYIKNSIRYEKSKSSKKHF